MGHNSRPLLKVVFVQIGKNPLWQFSLKFYGKPAVASCCLALQNRHGLNVNLVLLCVWLGKQRIVLPRELFGEILSDTALVHIREHVIAPLREQRDELKQAANVNAAALRTQVLKLELAGEKAEQDLLYQKVAVLAPVDLDALAAVLVNLNHYWQLQNLPPPNWKQVDALLIEAFSKLDKILLRQAVETQIMG